MKEVQELRNLREELLALPASEWDSYNNDFEKKRTLHDKSPEHLLSVAPLAATAFEAIESPKVLGAVKRLTGIDNLQPDFTRHYGAVHVAERGDYLLPHVDSALQPQTGLYKRVTLLVYIS